MQSTEGRDGGQTANADRPASSSKPNLEGRLELLTATRIEGWAWQAGASDDPVEVELYVDGALVARQLADRYRQDLAEAGIGEGRHSFEFVGVFSLNNCSLKIRDSEFYLQIQKTEIGDMLHSVYEIRRSGAFDEEFYLNEYKDVAGAEIDALEHYCGSGWREQRRPNFYFDPSWYAKQVGPGLHPEENPLLHFIKFGQASGVRPAIYFDPTWYKRTYALQPGESPLSHYIAEARTGLVSPLEDFDVAFYLSKNPDVLAAGIDPFRHFLESGFREGRNPSATFDISYYKRRYLPNEDANPFLHFLERRNDPTIITSGRGDERSWAGEIRRFANRGAAFEDFRPVLRGGTRRAKLLAFYLPQFHAFAENDSWWGTGFTEWTNVVRGAPRFEGHYQPRVPRDLGFYDLTKPGIMQRQVEIAKAAGIYGFVFYFYWFAKRRLMETPLDGLLASPSIDMPFCLMWANENWTRRWDGFDQEVLIAQDYADEDEADLVETWLRHFRDPRYIRIDGRPLVMVYRPGIIPRVREKAENWRRLLIASGERDPVLVMAQGFGDHDPLKFGFDGAIEFPPHKVAADLPNINEDLKLLDHDFDGTVVSYDAVVQRSVEEPAPEYPLIKSAAPSWDNDARRQGSGMVLHGSTPEAYEAWLERLISFAEHRPFLGERFVGINAWNEWAEGAYLEPDVHYGSAYLNATARAVSDAPRQGRHHICLVGHDAHPHGAQMLLQNLARLFVRQFGLEVEIVLLDGGRMLASYKEIAPTTIAGTDQDLRFAFQRLFRRGFRSVIVNSSASARAVEQASAAGLGVTLLVHELPSIISEMKLAPAIRRAAPFVRTAVFPAVFVRDQFRSIASLSDDRCLVRPQGCYTAVAFSAGQRDTVRNSLGIPPGETLVLGVGFADLRKGFDIFLNAWRASERRGLGLYFAWVGTIEQGIRTYLAAEIEAARKTDRFRTVSFTTKVASFYSAADVFFLSSREDPFPTVVLEALQAGLPVVAFDQTGGIPELLEQRNVGRSVALADAEAVVDAVVDLHSAWRSADRAADNRLTRIATETFAFDRYGFDLVARSLGRVPKISVVVPNYNYDRYLPSRLQSIFDQTFPIFELIVLDDASQDESLSTLAKVHTESGRDFQVVPNEKNSGSVFRQWRRAAELARGDYLWIAEADDDSSPAFLAALAAGVVDDTDVVLAFSDSRTIDENGRETAPSYKWYYAETSPGVFEQDQVFDGERFVRDHLGERNLIMNVSACLWQRSALLEAFDAAGDDLLSLKVAGDWRLYVAALTGRNARVSYSARPLNGHRRHGGSVTHSSLAGSRHVGEIRQVQETIRGLLPEAEALAGRQDAYLRRVADHLGVPEAAEAILASEEEAAAATGAPSARSGGEAALTGARVTAFGHR